eukprot:RCo042959
MQQQYQGTVWRQTKYGTAKHPFSDETKCHTMTSPRPRKQHHAKKKKVACKHTPTRTKTKNPVAKPKTAPQKRLRRMGGILRDVVQHQVPHLQAGLVVADRQMGEQQRTGSRYLMNTSSAEKLVPLPTTMSPSRIEI